MQMKPISHTTFFNTFPLASSLSYVQPGDKKYVTDDLYVIQSTQQQTYHHSYYWDETSYHHRKNFIGPIPQYKYIPCYKLMSVSQNVERKAADMNETCLASFSQTQWLKYRRSPMKMYAVDLMSYEEDANWGSRSCDWLCDALYYKAKPLEMYYLDGRLKSGFKNHLKRRGKGFANNSFATEVMLKALKNSITTIANDSNQADLFIMSTSNIVEEMNEFLENIYPRVNYCFSTNTITFQNHLDSSMISGTRTWHIKGLDLSALGYDMDSHSRNWLLENEIMIDGSVYNSTTVEITHCTECNTKTVVDATRDGLCVDCLGTTYRVHNYSHRVEESLGFDKRNKSITEPYLGIEIEYQVDKRKEGRLYVGDTLYNHSLMKEDGSIRNGFEIVSRPASYAQHMLRYTSFLDGLPEWMHPHQSCGMHVHISRTALSQMGAGKLVEFMNRDDNKKFIQLIAGRKATNYQRAMEDYDIKKPYKIDRGNDHADRYNYINLSNKKTIELRIFASPKNTNEFKVRMQFVKAMISYCQPAALTGTLKEQTSFSSFITWLENTKKEFRELHTYVKESALCA
jgi:hypothetical protein